jgi:hypothetical protein
MNSGLDCVEPDRGRCAKREDENGQWRKDGNLHEAQVC